MKSTIVTGGTGFIGSNLVRKLVYENWDVHLIVRENSSMDNIKDVLDKVTIFIYRENLSELIMYFKDNSPDVVFHLASLFITEHIPDDIDNIISSNITFGVQLLEAMKESNTRNIVDTGTSWQHYHSNSYVPVNLYAATKEAFQKIEYYYHLAHNINVIVLKLFDTYGESDKRGKLINILSKIADSENEIEMSHGLQKLDFLHVDDVVEGFLVACRTLQFMKTPQYSVYSLRSNKEYSLKSVVELFELIYGKKLNITWGGRKYREREVMTLWCGTPILPNWNPKIGMVKGINRIIQNNKKETI